METDLSAGASAAQGRRGTTLLLAALLVASTLLAYGPALHGRRLLDDDLHITAPALQSVAGLARIWFRPGATQQYYPVVHTAFWLEHRVWGESDLGYHLVNVFLHALASLLVVPLMRQLRLPGAWFAAFLFALHPVCVESVAWMAEQKNTLSLVFALGAMIAYLQFEERRDFRRYGLALGLFALALLSKTAVVTEPVVLLVLVWGRRSRLDWRRDVGPLLPWFGLGGAIGLVTVAVERQLIAGVGESFALGVPARALLAGRAFWFYLGKIVWPAQLTFFYPRWVVDPGVPGQYVYPLAVILAGLVLLRMARTTKWPLVVFLGFACTLLPILGFIRIEWFVFSYVADHLQYLASLAIIIPVGAFLGAARVHRSGRWLIGGALAVLLGLLTWRQCDRYSDPEKFYRTAIELNPSSAAAYDKLGTVLAASPSRLPEAVAAFDQALRIRPEMPGTHYNRGSAKLSLGLLPEAIADLEEARRQQPESPDTLTNLGVAFARSGRLPEAIACYEAAHRLEPGAGDTLMDLAQAHFDFGMSLARGRRFAEAAGQFAEAVRLRPDFEEAQMALRNVSILERQLPP